jgi:hypothetical protein
MASRPFPALAVTIILVSAMGLAAGVQDGRADDQQHAADARRAAIGAEIAAQNGIDLEPITPSIGLGSYLVNVAGCNDCHTWPNYVPNRDPFARQPAQVNVANYLAGGREFDLPTAKFCSRNITPAPGTHMPAGLSEADFLYLIRTGCDPQDPKFREPQQCTLLQVMPWPLYRQMATSDLKAIYAYLSALPTTEPGTAAQCTPEGQGIAAQ